ncbi:MAG: SGNH/GDSL hydrolase family protein, partial [Bacteroidia bacterium]
LMISILLLSLSSCNQKKPSILIIGDSISIGYTPFVKESLVKQAVVIHNPGNAQHTGTGLAKIEEWLAEGDWDIVQFNWGLWDLCYRHPDSKVQGNRDKINGTLTYTLDQYAANLDSIVSILKSNTEAKLIFVTTSYVPENEAGRYTDDAIKYNDVAKKIMQKHSILVNDIYAPSIPIHQQFGKGSDDVHYSKQGYKKLSELVASFLKAEMASLKSK